MKNKKTRSMAYMSLFLAIEILLVCVPFLGFIPIGPMRATTLHIPVIIAGIVLGKNKGAFLGLVFGISSLIINTIQPTITSFVFSPFLSGSFMSVIIAIVPRVCIGYVSGFIYEHFKQHEYPAMVAGSLLGSLTNTILVLLGIYLLFGKEYALALNKDISTLLPYFITILSTSGILEAIVGTVLAVPVSKTLLKIYK